MALIKYLDSAGLRTLVHQIKNNTSKLYTVKGTGIYADEAYLARDDKRPEINARGLWAPDNGVYTHVTEVRVGWVYNIENSFTTDADFREYDSAANDGAGEGVFVRAGTNIVAVESSDSGIKWDVLATAVDMAAYQTKKLEAVIPSFEVNTDSDDFSAVYGVDSYAALRANYTKDNTVDGTTFIVTNADDADYGNVYRAVVSSEDIAFDPLGNQNTVEGALQLIGNTAPNTPIPDKEIGAAFDNVD